ncbi:MAG: hypothetical protein RPS47_12650 [Colwellia sp.]|jgi:hypothetical protein
MIKQPLAFSLTGKIKDCGHTKFSCDVCGRTTRFAWLAKSRKPGSDIEIKVGLGCAKLLHNPFCVDEKEAATWIDVNAIRLTRDSRYQRLLSVVLTIKKKEPKLDFKRIIKCIKDKEGLSPGQAGLIASLIKKYNISVDQDVLKVKLNTKKSKEQLQKMKPWVFKDLHRYLQPRQSKMAEKLIAPYE